METGLIDYTNDIISLAEVNERCEKYIISNYSIGKQLTLERTGTDEQKLIMHAFIDACRAWANSEHPKVHELYEIQP
ncbi:hypothetical protein [Vibrio campbellii]|uniref:Uncharacterized protein n=1 Tax=Vibrio campbellii (strain ATCC BAA-1116) TaxID=2902295 RepID=A7N226_VIBC1|nr:hypothetical protein [Vibrio campbellii]ABU72953.1 hypothetical protein VIBHAR_05046 [Vibrio campbellii ATCC BAA-1116]AGU98835.1 hypothetical protein M892_25970 [Vibrio campbellii ATCC BAA-1116]MBT0121291.1 hypothetical protein [Vibrio campbellii]MBT0136428.1 hypothetical protein [Vibrio campbellii]MBT0141058.1 hypothetical protein [Vibrio campbellii]